MKYRQCTLRLTTSDGHTEQTSYIPDKYAKVGKILQLKENDIWTDGWEVISIHHEPTDEPPDFRKMIRGHRKNTGDSLPKNG